jgi:predicted pyridoxine 5'-phosphate oxidase superfamily flavin-nucleotide-binding protein
MQEPTIQASEVPAFVVVRTTNTTDEPPDISVMSRQSQDPNDHPFFADPAKMWHLVFNPFYTGLDSMPMIIAEVVRDLGTTVKIINEPRQHLKDACKDLRRLVMEEMERLVSQGDVRMQYKAGWFTAEDIVSDGAKFEYGSGHELRYMWYTIRPLMTKTK